MSAMMETLKFYYHNHTNGRKIHRKVQNFSRRPKKVSRCDFCQEQQFPEGPCSGFLFLYDISLLWFVQLYCLWGRSHSKINSTKHVDSMCARAPSVGKQQRQTFPGTAFCIMCVSGNMCERGGKNQKSARASERPRGRLVKLANLWPSVINTSNGVLKNVPRRIH